MIILASQSEIRRTLLKNAGVTFTAATSPLDEAALQLELKNLAPYDMANELAKAKAKAFDPQHTNDLIIGVDQTFELHGQIIHKPKSKSQAKDHLLSLNGKTHQLHTAYAMFRQHQLVASYSDTATLTMRSMSDVFIDAYLASTPNSILTSVGCYQLEGLGVQLMQEIKGDYFSILGLPLLPLLEDLRKLGEIAS